jgi:hypothetical protein
VAENAVPSEAMSANRRPRAARALLALALCLALLGPGAAVRAAAGADASASLTAGPAVGLQQGLLHERTGRSLVAPWGKRDDRERPGLALPGVLAVVVATVSMVVAGRRAARHGGRRAAAAGARAPPSFRLAPI